MENNLEKILVWFNIDDFVKIDGFDYAIIGIDSNEIRLIYSVTKCIKILSNEMDEENATQYFFEVLCPIYYGKHSPIFCLDNL